MKKPTPTSVLGYILIAVAAILFYFVYFPAEFWDSIESLFDEKSDKEILKNGFAFGLLIAGILCTMVGEAVSGKQSQS